jgi:hypothetical protein
VKRKSFIRACSVFVAGALFGACGVNDSGSRSNGGRGGRSNGNEPERRYAEKFKSEMPGVSGAAKDPGIYTISENGHTYAFSAVPAGEGHVQHPHLRLQADNEAPVFLMWGLSGTYPSLKLLDENGNDVAEVGFNEFTGTHNHSPREWLEIGLKVAAAIFVIWIGLEIGALLLSFLASLAFFFLCLVILFAGIAVIGGFIKAIFEDTEWDERLSETMGNAVEWLARQFRQFAGAHP